MKSIIIIFGFLLLGIVSGIIIGKVVRPTPHAQIIMGDYTKIIQPSDNKIVMFSLSTCPHCADARKYMRRNHIAFKEYQIDKSKIALDQFTKIRESSVPIIFEARYKMRGFTPGDMRKFVALGEVQTGGRGSAKESEVNQGDVWPPPTSGVSHK